jgi:hypothetical protein
MWKRLETWQNNFDTSMTRNRYLDLCEKLNQEPNPDKLPPEIEDFPEEVQKAIVTYNKLGDRVVADIGYLGKDYTSLPLYLQAYNIQNTELFIEVILRMDEKTIKKSADSMKAERDKIARASKK